MEEEVVEARVNMADLLERYFILKEDEYCCQGEGSNCDIRHSESKYDHLISWYGKLVHSREMCPSKETNQKGMGKLITLRKKKRRLPRWTKKKLI